MYEKTKELDMETGSGLSVDSGNDVDNAGGYGFR